MNIRIWVDERIDAPDVYKELDGDYIWVNTFEDLVGILLKYDEQDVEVIDFNTEEDAFEQFVDWSKQKNLVYLVSLHDDSVIKIREKKRYIRYWRLD